MREIKFRAWDKYQEQMNLNVESGIYEDPDETIDFDTVLSLERFVVMQYTGLKDKNGEKIYEGDVIEVTSELFTNFGKTPTGRYSTSLEKVIWYKNGFGTEKIKSDGHGMIEGYKTDCIEIRAEYGKVIGNIYENPELLEVNNESK